MAVVDLGHVVNGLPLLGVTSRVGWTQRRGRGRGLHDEAHACTHAHACLYMCLYTCLSTKRDVVQCEHAAGLHAQTAQSLRVRAGLSHLARRLRRRQRAVRCLREVSVIRSALGIVANRHRRGGSQVRHGTKSNFFGALCWPRTYQASFQDVATGLTAVEWDTGLSRQLWAPARKATDQRLARVLVEVGV